MQKRAKPVQRIAAAVLTAGLLCPALGRAADADLPPDEAPPPAETHWYDGASRNFDVGFDAAVVRPLAALTLAGGATLFPFAALLTLPNGLDSVNDAKDRFVIEPWQYLVGRPLGD